MQARMKRLPIERDRRHQSGALIKEYALLDFGPDSKGFYFLDAANYGTAPKGFFDEVA